MTEGQHTSPRVGTLGSALTFAGQATAALVARRPEYVRHDDFPTMDAVAAAVTDGAIDLGVLTSETANTACTETAARLLAGEPLYVADEIVVPYHCALLGRPGSDISSIRHVGGHGSIRQCGPFLREELPHATAEIHRLNSVEAAREVLDGDGTTAVIATLAVAERFGLHILARDVDRGSTAGWWALSSELVVRSDADHVAVRLGGTQRLVEFVAGAAAMNLRIRTVTNAPTGDLFAYRYLVTARTVDGRPVDPTVIERLGADLIGVYPSVDERSTDSTPERAEETP